MSLIDKYMGSVSITSDMVAQATEQTEEKQAYTVGQLVATPANTEPTVLNSKIVIHKSSKMEVAKRFFEFMKAMNVHIKNYNGSFMYWVSGQYIPLDDMHVEYMVRKFVISKCVYADVRLPTGAYLTASKGSPEDIVDSKLMEMLRYESKITEEQSKSQWLGESEKPEVLNHVIPVKNGLYDYRNNVVYEHTPYLFLTHQLPITYHHEEMVQKVIKNTHNKIAEFLREVLPNRDQRLLLMEFIGYLISGRTDKQKLLMLYGATRSGKGVIVHLITKLLGDNNVTTRTARNTDESFGLEGIDKASLCVFNELTVSAKLSKVFTDTINAIVGEDEVVIQRKYKESIRTKLNTRIILVSNSIPHINEMSGAFERRLLTITFEESIPDEKINPHLKEELLQELEYLVFYAVMGLHRLEQSGWTKTYESEELVNTIRTTSNSVKEFVSVYCKTNFTHKEEVPNGQPRYVLKIRSQDLYERYLEFCQIEGSYPINNQVFGKQLKEMFPKIQKQLIMQNKQRVSWYLGITLKEEDEIECATF